ncbi:auxin-responsive protein SAUR76-like [Senna tora]|uniref:Auxin-responsive protein SAUR76-like n=1 Tax=Senna tora TaxID=362788 RepID=A0A835CCP2_9FABA|nr:auxin-responsive protein SAUR76-like [Senna tora]
MPKNGKLMKLKSVLKKWNSFGNKQGRGSCNGAVVADIDDDDDSRMEELHPVFVGKSRRRYLVSSDVVDHPLFRELVERSGVSGGEDDVVGANINIVSCEVVLFEHLLWMLQNADPQPDALHDLVDFYAC